MAQYFYDNQKLELLNIVSDKEKSMNSIEKKILNKLKKTYNFSEAKILSQKTNKLNDDNFDMGKTIYKIFVKTNNWLGVIDYNVYYIYQSDVDSYSILKESQPKLIFQKKYNGFVDFKGNSLGTEYILFINDEYLMQYKIEDNSVHRFCENDSINGKIILSTFEKNYKSYNFYTTENNTLYKCKISSDYSWNNISIYCDFVYTDEKEITNVQEVETRVRNVEPYILTFADNTKRYIDLAADFCDSEANDFKSPYFYDMKEGFDGVKSKETSWHKTDEDDGLTLYYKLDENSDWENYEIDRHGKPITQVKKTKAKKKALTK